MSSLEFSFQESLNEIDALAKVAQRFLDPSSRPVLDRLSTELENIRDTVSERSALWGIKESFPLLTSVSRGSYQPNDEGEHNVYAEITSVWEIRRVRPPGRRLNRAQHFALTGLASTRVRLFKKLPDGSGSQLAMWRMEIADTSAPGCHFHVQILGDLTEGQFPKSLDVPRFPSIIATPPAVVEYVLAELFQEGWIQHISTRSADLQRWIPIQRGRLSRVLDWQSKVVKASSASPWPTLKKAKPDWNLFLEQAG